jgi:CubicO group peptidase (beta-lactamase class C family)
MMGEQRGKAHTLAGGLIVQPTALDHPDASGELYWGGVAGTQWWISPKQNMAGVMMAQRQMAICEGSDWFWWFGDYNPAATVSDFERLFRLQLANLYQLIGAVPPDYLAQVFAHGAGAPQLGGVMRPGKSE